MSLTPADVSGGGIQHNGGNNEPVAFRPRRLALALLLAYMAGIVFAVFVPIDARLPWTAGLVLLAASFVFPVLAERHGALLAVTLLAAWSGVSGHLARHAEGSLPLSNAKGVQFVDVTGRILSDPDTRTDTDGMRPRYTALVELESMRRGGVDVPVQGRVYLRMGAGEEGAVEAPAYGDRWRWRGVLKLDRRPVVRSRGMAGFLDTSMARSDRIARDVGHRFVAWCYALRERAARQLGHGLEPDHPSVIFTRALLLGLRGDVAPEVRDAFSRTGTLHILALSGMHVVILAMLLVVVLKACRITQTGWAYFFVPFLAVYTIGTGASASMVRAAVMASVFFTAFALRRRPDPPTSLAVSAWIVLLIDPLQLFDLGFILSFAVVAGLIVICPVWQGMYDAWMADGDDVPVEEPGGLRDRLRYWGRQLWSMTGVSLAAWMSSLPIIATAFHLVSPIGLLVNLPLIPLSTLVLFTSCLSMVTGVISPFLASLFNHANVLLCEALVRLVDATARIPGGHLYVPPWSWLAIIGWYIVLAVWVARRGRWRWVASIVLVGLVMASILHRRLSREVTVVAWPTGSACAVLVDGPGERAVLIDPGSRFHTRATVDRLHERGIAHLDQVVISRATVDAYGGLGDLLTQVAIDRISIPAVPPRYKEFQISEVEWMDHSPGVELARRNGPMILDVAGTSYAFLFPAENGYQSARASSAMIRISRGHASVLYVGMADEALEEEAMALPVDWNADILIAGRWESAHALSAGWLDRVQPAHLIINSRPFDRQSADGVAALRKNLKNSALLVSDLSRGDIFTAKF